jgi:hypothetical protein
MTQNNVGWLRAARLLAKVSKFGHWLCPYERCVDNHLYLHSVTTVAVRARLWQSQCILTTAVRQTG